jgi:hypothetical protein
MYIAEAQVTCAINFEQRSLDDGRVCQHERSGQRGVEWFTRLHGQFSPGRSTAVEERLPAEVLYPRVQQVVVQSIAAQVVKAIVNPMVCKPAPRLPDAVAVFDAVEDYHVIRTVLNQDYSPQRRRENNFLG